MSRNIDDYSEKYEIGEFEAYQVNYRRRLVIEQIDKYHPKKVLEIGCGLEPLFLYVEGVEFTVVEPSVKFYQNAMQLKKNKNVNLICDYLNVELAETLEDNYDMIICSALLHEVENPCCLLDAIKTLSNNETVIHINVPNAFSFHRIWAAESGLIDNPFEKSDRNIILQQNNVFDLCRLKEIIKMNGFMVLDEGSYFVKPFAHNQMEILINEKIINENLLDGLYKLSKYFPQYGSEIYVNCKII